MECLENSALIWKVLTRIEQYDRPVNLTDYSSFENILQTSSEKQLTSGNIKCYLPKIPTASRGTP